MAVAKTAATADEDPPEASAKAPSTATPNNIGGLMPAKTASPAEVAAALVALLEPEPETVAVGLEAWASKTRSVDC